jgi:hypothetical protein
MHKKHLIKLIGLTVLAAISAMAVTASAAQAKYLLLLNEEDKTQLTFNIEILPGGYMKADNGLKVACSGGTGTGSATLSGDAKTVGGSATVNFSGCVWVGSEKTCTIKAEGVSGRIHASGTGAVSMSGSKYFVTAASSEFTVIHSEGAFCTIPEEEVVSGSATIEVEGAEAETKLKKAHFSSEALFLGEAEVEEIVGEASITDLNPNATFGIRLVPGCFY